MPAKGQSRRRPAPRTHTRAPRRAPTPAPAPAPSSDDDDDEDGETSSSGAEGDASSDSDTETSSSGAGDEDYAPAGGRPAARAGRRPAAARGAPAAPAAGEPTGKSVPDTIFDVEGAYEEAEELFEATLAALRANLPAGQHLDEARFKEAMAEAGRAFEAKFGYPVAAFQGEPLESNTKGVFAAAVGGAVQISVLDCPLHDLLVNCPSSDCLTSCNHAAALGAAGLDVRKTAAWDWAFLCRCAENRIVAEREDGKKPFRPNACVPVKSARGRRGADLLMRFFAALVVLTGRKIAFLALGRQAQKALTRSKLAEGWPTAEALHPAAWRKDGEAAVGSAYAATARAATGRSAPTAGTVTKKVRQLIKNKAIKIGPPPPKLTKEQRSASESFFCLQFFLPAFSALFFRTQRAA
jgi:hypothetical protein